MNKLVDKGRCLLYDRLSYRRRFLRSLWMMPLPLVLFFFPESIFAYLAEAAGVAVISRLAAVRFMMFMFLLQAIYNVYMWRVKGKVKKDS